jgi:hypothetical protein
LRISFRRRSCQTSSARRRVEWGGWVLLRERWKERETNESWVLLTKETVTALCMRNLCRELRWEKGTDAGRETTCGRWVRTREGLLVVTAGMRCLCVLWMLLVVGNLPLIVLDHCCSLIILYYRYLGKRPPGTILLPLVVTGRWERHPALSRDAISAWR